MGIFRTLLWIVLIYLVYRIFTNLIRPGRKKSPSVKGTPKRKMNTPPYDPDNVEDIDYTEVKKKKKE